jgi:hypothetical protein
MNLGTVLSLIEMALKVFHSERQDKYLKRYLKIKEQYEDELNKGLSGRSDLAIMRLLSEADDLAKLVISEQSRD